MSKNSLFGSIAILVCLLIFSISPLASIGGVIVAAGVVAPIGIVLGLAGVLEPGRGFDTQLEIIFWIWSAMMALIAFWQFYRAADYADKQKPEKSRRCIAIALSVAVLPVVVALCYNALGF